MGVFRNSPHWSPVCLPSNDSSSVSFFSRACCRAGCRDHSSSTVPTPSLLSQHPLEVGIVLWKHWNNLSESVLEQMSTWCRNALATVSMALPHVELSSASRLSIVSPRSQSPVKQTSKQACWRHQNASNTIHFEYVWICLNMFEYVWSKERNISVCNSKHANCKTILWTYTLNKFQRYHLRGTCKCDQMRWTWIWHGIWLVMNDTEMIGHHGVTRGTSWYHIML